MVSVVVEHTIAGERRAAPDVARSDARGAEAVAAVYGSVSPPRSRTIVPDPRPEPIPGPPIVKPPVLPVPERPPPPPIRELIFYLLPERVWNIGGSGVTIK